MCCLLPICLVFCFGVVGLAFAYLIVVLLLPGVWLLAVFCLLVLLIVLLDVFILPLGLTIDLLIAGLFGYS